MLAFDTDLYTKTVLAPAAAGGPVPDVFARYLLEPRDQDKRSIERRMAEVKAHWDKLDSKNNAKYSGLLARLIGEHTQAGLTLLSDVERRRAAEGIESERAEADERRSRDATRFEQKLEETLARDAGLTTRGRRMLEEFSRGLDLGPETVARRLDGCPAVAEHARSDPLPENVRATIRQALVDYAAACGTPSKGVSLFHALDLPGPEYDRASLTSSWERQADHQRTLTVEHPAKVPMATVLSFARVHLIESDPSAYAATLVAEVREALRPLAAEAAINDNAIDALESERLVRAAQERGIPAEEARDLVVELASNLGVELRLGSAVDYIACAHCNRPHPLTSAPDRCSNCGKPLFRDCPKCKDRRPASDRACSSCGLDLAGYARSLQAMSDAQLALESGQISLAAAMVRDTGGDPDNEDHRRLAADIAARIRQARSDWEAVEREIGERRLYTAMLHLARMELSASDVSSPSGSTVGERRESVAGRLRTIERSISAARDASGPAREQDFASALEQAVDCREALQELARTPPLAPTDLQATVEDEGVRLSWKESGSPGPIHYRITRAVGKGSAGGEIERTMGRSATDLAPPPGEAIRYGVSSERAGTTSQPTYSPWMVVVRDVEEMSVTEREGEVRLAWRAVGSGARVDVERTDENGETKQLAPDPEGIVDRDVKNDTRYRYRVSVVCAGPDGNLLKTAGRVVFATPAQRPEPVSDLSAEIEQKLVRLRFGSPPHGTVVILRCASQPSLKDGETIADDEEEAQIGERLPHDSDGVYDHDPSPAWYLPVSHSGSYLVAGHAIRHLALPPIADVAGVDLGDSVRVTWAWPERVRAAVVVWRRDRQPSGLHDEQAQRLTITQAQYSDQGGAELPTDGDQPVFIAVYSATRIDGDFVGSSGTDRRARLAVNRSRKSEVRYAVRRSGLRKRRVCFEILGAQQQALPELVVVAKPGELLPRSPEDGRVIASLGGRQGEHRHELDLGEIGRPVAIRMFVRSAAEARTHSVCHPDARELVFR